MPVLDHAGPVEDRQRKGENHHHDLSRDDDLPFWKRVDEYASGKGQKQHGSELERGDDAEFEGGMGQIQHQPRLAHVLHPGADEGHELSCEEQTKVPVAQRAEQYLYSGGILHGCHICFLVEYIMRGFDLNRQFDTLLEKLFQNCDINLS